MKEFYIFPKTIEDIQRIINVFYRIDCDIKVSSENYTANGKSILGMMSLAYETLYKVPLKVTIETIDEDDYKDLRMWLKNYLVEA